MKFSPQTLLLPAVLALAPLQANAAIIAHYTFDETSGTTAADSVRGAGGVATVGGGGTWGTGKIGGALTLDGTNDYAWAVDPLPNANITNLSISAWVYADTAKQWGTITAAWGSGEFLYGFSSTSGNIGVYLNTSGGDPAIDPNDLTLNAWHHVAFAYDGAAATRKLYVDGALVATTVAPTILTSHGTNMGIGAKLSSGTSTVPPGTADAGYWDGKIDDLSMWNETLTQTQITSIYNNGLNGIAVPEPAAALLGGLGLLSLMRRRRA